MDKLIEGLKLVVIGFSAFVVLFDLLFLAALAFRKKSEEEIEEDAREQEEYLRARV